MNRVLKKVGRVEEMWRILQQLTDKRQDYSTSANGSSDRVIRFSRANVQEGTMVEAERICRESLEVLEKELGLDNAWTLQVVSVLDHVHMQQRNFERAEEMFRMVLQGLRYSRSRKCPSFPRLVRSITCKEKYQGHIEL